MPTLYLVPIPLSDPDDITLRALRILQTAAAVAAADARALQALFEHHKINNLIISYGEVIERLISGDVALVAASGTPGMGDAAHDLVVEAIRRGIRVEPLPGANAAITAPVRSGLPTDAFAYFDALPADLARLAHDPATLIFRAAEPLAALARLHDALGDRTSAVAYHLTQADEFVFRGILGDVLAEVRRAELAGDCLIVVAGAPPEIAETWDEARVRAELRRRFAAGEPLKQIAKEIAAQASWDRRTVYALGVEEKGRQNSPQKSVYCSLQ